ncbi:C45 family peptidase [Streptomyces litchfieldiae]|uniref:C45 family peptidase n=1 Tax=Streptomyces litchfieldiae TaxID=3075543 RepID=A0ABU2N131_9ACTN|nr:C45 family peptidase [Streptomyces sp. DSM 44938]MDT0347616.1 C45 family peptidase [Streptomyces sp. DSM 44938]
MTRHITFHAIEVGDARDGSWTAPLLARVPEELDRWVPDEVRTPAGDAAAREQFAEHLPELLPVLDLLVSQGEGQPGLTALLAEVGLRNPFRACSQIGGVAGTLLRNYDWDLGEAERTIVSSTLLRPVIGTAEGLWGLLDGMNDAGLAISLTYGGRPVHGPGFGIPVVLRYVLETCETVLQALAVLGRVPIATAQNVTVVDRDEAVTVHLGPDIAPTRAADACATNHQHLPLPEEQARTSSTYRRLETVRAAGESGDPDAIVAALLRPPLHEYDEETGYGTMYTAAYRPAEGRVTYHWPAQDAWEQSFKAFDPGSRKITYGALDG